MDWYYLSDTHERIAISEAQLTPLAAIGVLRPATPVWHRGMADWAACGEVKPEVFTALLAGREHQPHPAAEGAAVRGTVIGLARALAGYSLWLRILGVLTLLGSVTIWVSMVVTGYYLITADEAAWKLILENLHWAAVPRTAVWALLAFQGVLAPVTAWAGFVLLTAASRARRAAESGNELILTAAIRDTGRYFMTSVFLILVTILFISGLVLWLGWDVVKPSRQSAAEKVISI